jgi:hypothetical protein
VEGTAASAFLISGAALSADATATRNRMSPRVPVLARENGRPSSAVDDVTDRHTPVGGPAE